MKEQVKFLGILIDTNESMKERGGLSETGEAYLEGLKKAYDMVRDV